MKTLSLAEKVIEAFDRNKALSLGALNRNELSDLVRDIKKLIG